MRILYNRVSVEHPDEESATKMFSMHSMFLFNGKIRNKFIYIYIYIYIQLATKILN